MLFFSGAGGKAQADQPIRALSESAAAVKQPAGVYLTAICRAGNRLVAAGEHGVIIYSDDNGANWRQAKVPVNLTITSVAFATPMVGWAGGDLGAILHTTDGGATWSLQLDGLRVNKMTMAIAQALNAKNPNDPKAVVALRRATIFTQDGADKPFLTVLPIDANKAFVFGAYRLAVVTTDGGRSWQDISLSVGDPVSHNLYDAIMVNQAIYLAGEEGLIFKSTDGGNSFPQLGQPMDATAFGVLVTNGTDILLFGVAGNISRSVDAGAHWSPLDLGTSASLVAGRVLKSGVIVIAGQNGTVYVSHDNGQTFQPDPQTQDMAISDLEQAANGDVVFAGSAGIRVDKSLR